jgi:GDP-L-fucose synthase
MPTNLYGIGDNYELENSHVLPAMIRKFHETKNSGVNQVVLWGDGFPLWEFLCSDDLADTMVYLMEKKTQRIFATAPEILSTSGAGRSSQLRSLRKPYAPWCMNRNC